MIPETGEAFEGDLRAAMRGLVAFDEITRGLYSTDASIYQIQPVAVCMPLDEDDVQAAVAVAVKHGVSILPRGGGTSLAGQTVGASLVLDFSKHMNRILELNVEERWVRVQPGVVRDELNAELEVHGLHCAPDPATGNRANIGGMIGNNSSGTKSIIYGKTVDHVIATRNLLTNGEIVEFRSLTSAQVAQKAKGETREAAIYRGFTHLIDQNRDEIERRFPKVMRRVGGYNLDEFTHCDEWNLSKLVTGSEGTLATLLDATVNLEPLPKASTVCLIHFADLQEAIRAVKPIVEHGPSAVEILDRIVLRMARDNLMTRHLCDIIEDDPAAVLIVEFYADSDEDALRKVSAMAGDIRARGMGFAFPVFTNAADKEKVWTIRKNGLGLMLGVKGDQKPTAFIEDACVSLDVLPEYIDRVLSLCKAKHVDVAMYAHASVGVIHVRPMLDLRLPADIENLKRIAEETFELVKEYEGSWSGEHGDGLVRSPFMERFFGTQIYSALREVKQMFDPEGLMNPGKIVDAPPMDQDLRFGTGYAEPPLHTVFKYREDESFGAAVRMCTGVGACRKTLGGTMCPSYMATREEKHTTRGRANALRLAMSGQLGKDGLASPELLDVLDLCLSCKACKSECPSNVDVAKLKAEVLQIHHDRHGASRRERLLAGSLDAARRICGPLAPALNALQRTALFRGAMQSVAGIDRRRILPSYARQTFTSWFERSRPEVADEPSDRTVVLFDDSFINFFEPHIGRAATELLESCGYRVVLARAGCCQRPRISHGFLREARDRGVEVLRNLDRYIQKGWPVVVCEPSCAAALTDDLPDLIDDKDLGDRILANVHMIDVFLAREQSKGNIAQGFSALVDDVLLHGHCNQKALYGTAGMKNIWSSIGGLDHREVDSGCCGMAGSFGYEKEHYDLSQVIGEDRLFPAVRSAGSATVVACGFSCRHQIADATGVKAMHWVETVRGCCTQTSPS
ncbi:MAG: FAD-binding protein [Verrucomicrobia bacterium]|nr:FAD-binding protein [Verrucomicrobiota bacterium]MDA1086118.1 FAD-binding protein [Verrucomicrobiota bacterium]